MVVLSLFSPKANVSSRFFPYHGYLGLTPLRVEGIVRTKLDEDNKPLQAKSLTVAVRCYESKLGRLGVLQSHVLADYSQTLWSKRDDAEYEDLAESEHCFRITLPANAPGFSTAHFVDYRVFWRVEAVITHVPITGLGTRIVKSFELPLIRYDVPRPALPPSPLSPHHTLSPPSSSSSLKSKLKSTSSSSRGVRYRVETPAGPVGPGDLVSVGVWVKPGEERVVVKSASLAVERRIEVREGQPQLQEETLSPQTQSQTPLQLQPQSALGLTLPPLPYYTLPSTTTVDTCTSTTPLLSPRSPRSRSGSSSSTPLHLTTSPPTSPPPALLSALLSPFPSPTSPPSPISPAAATKTHVQTIASASSGSLEADSGEERGAWGKTLTVQWPVGTRGHSRWGIGESMGGLLGEVRFVVRVKIALTSPHGTEHVELDYQPELHVVSTNEAERQLALSKYNEAREKPKSKSKSPRRSGREREGAEGWGPSPPPPPMTNCELSSSSNSTASSSHGPASTAPTSEGGCSPGMGRGKASSTCVAQVARAGERERQGERERERGERERKKVTRRGPRRPHTSAGPSETTRKVEALVGHGGGGLGRAGDAHIDLRLHPVPEKREREKKEREWEEELRRIEVQSRRSSVGMAGWRGKVARVVMGCN